MSLDAPFAVAEDAQADKSARRLDERALRTLFTDARTANGFLDRPVPRETLERLVELVELGPTAANSVPLRLVFVQSPEAKERLRPVLSEGNVAKTMAAPVTAIVAADLRFYEHFPRLFPHRDMRAGFAGEEKAAFAAEFAKMNATLQGGYLILAARALGLDAGPMGGFDRAKTDAEFFPDGTLASIFLVNLGYGDDTQLFGRNPRLNVDEVARFI